MLYTGKYEGDTTQIVLGYLQDAVEEVLDYIRYPQYPPTPEKLERLETLRQGVKEAHFQLELICNCLNAKRNACVYCQNK